MIKPTTLLQSYIREEDILMLPVAHDALCARIAMQIGFKAIACGGYSSTAALLGCPDVSLLTMTEMAEWAGRLAEASGLPVLADGDTGYGGVLNVIRTVRCYERAGAAGIILEDQSEPKRCGHMSGKRVIPSQEMAGRILAALEARSDPDFVIAARTDALEVLGLKEAILRGNLYREVGADLIFVDAPTSIEQMRQIASEIRAPTMVNMIPGGKTPLMPASDLQEMGFSVVAYATSCTYAIARAARDMLQSLRMDGRTDGAELMDFDEFNDLVGLEEIRALERRYLKDETPLP
ncbi:MAG: 2-methylisocitrate lyase [Methanosaeta sp. PtaB.Bin039]|nr:MAG: 2-methylisocitrate lyase [Methanosaeta sp. PtaB.Bin039]HOT06821.1 isocitrate lyase/PEP mutase family protein [Methanotrichaceae archaeon]HQF16717.1 isocitrate lyase/PEP mutase family protein [Methanotrichaceae archaeon]HQI91349.1 isocitrate lyase/PEP mutase family protein [Methanotrichaceae archaeon]HQJ28685.1 isocitrate lyase/PEP mutase family protein [Methanotrichaceae archaeon]